MEDICEQCHEPSDCLDDNLICMECKIQAADFYLDFYKDNEGE